MLKVVLAYTVSSRPARAQEKVEGGRGREMRSGKYVWKRLRPQPLPQNDTMSPDETGVPPTVGARETQVKRLSFLEQRVHRALVLTGLAGVGKPSPVPPLWREGNRRLPWIFSGPSPNQSSGVNS